MEQLGRPLIVMGVFIVVLGLLMTVGPKLPFKLGQLPLDFQFRRGNFQFYFPLGTLILVNIVLALVISLFNRR